MCGSGDWRCRSGAVELQQRPESRLLDRQRRGVLFSIFDTEIAQRTKTTCACTLLLLLLLLLLSKSPTETTVMPWGTATKARDVPQDDFVRLCRQWVRVGVVSRVVPCAQNTVCLSSFLAMAPRSTKKTKRSRGERRASAPSAGCWWRTAQRPTPPHGPRSRFAKSVS